MEIIPVIGLEVHLQLRTATKMFCGDSAEFGGKPNSRVCPVCLGLPGALPVANRRAVELAVRAALGLHCDIHPRSGFDRKSYFYPDLPKGYQITQHRRPLATGGYLEVPGEGGTQQIEIVRAHLEEDSGRSVHDEAAGVTAVDFNRAGVPLLEIVTAPQLRSPAEARALLVRLRQAMEYLDVSDCSMEEGSLRVDANVSVRRIDEPPRRGTEIKNLNSFSGVERALAHEIERQSLLVRSGGEIEPVTLTWDSSRGVAREMRGKEAVEEYRYLPEPDLPPLQLDPRWIDGIRRAIPEMPWRRETRFGAEYSLPPEQARALTSRRDTANYFERVVAAGADPRAAASWVLGEVLAASNAEGASPTSLRVGPERLAGLIALVEAGRISRFGARRVFGAMLQSDTAAEALVRREGLGLVTDTGPVREWVREAFAEHPREAARLRSGEEKLVAFFVGVVMRSSGGRADPVRVGRVVREMAG